MDDSPASLRKRSFWAPLARGVPHVSVAYKLTFSAVSAAAAAAASIFKEGAPTHMYWKKGIMHSGASSDRIMDLGL